MHVLPQLRKLEHKYGRELVIVGVHAGKFLAERATENIRQAVLRLEVDHPVVNDLHFRIWRSYGVNAWPTLALIDPDGGYVGSHAGEITFESFDPVVGQVVAEFDSRRRLHRSPLTFRLEREAEPQRPLAFPGKVLATPDGRLFIADTNHNRILVVRLDAKGEEGTVEEIVGSGQAGLQDDDLTAATFDHPLGMAPGGDILYVADTGNNAIRAVDLVKRRVETIAGTGEQGRRLHSVGPAHRVALGSPWDLCLHQNMLHVAMAGTHQLWVMNLVNREVGPYAGGGNEDLIDGDLSRASLAQPSGIATDGRRLYFADTESSAIRWADLGPPGQVHTIVGKGLFTYGDKDGVGDEVLLQHSQGIAWHEGRLYVADTYNDKIKVVEPDTRRVSTLPGTGDSALPLDEPGGLSAANGRLYIADTNNHTIRFVDLVMQKAGTLRLIGI